MKKSFLFCFTLLFIGVVSKSFVEEIISQHYQKFINSEEFQKRAAKPSENPEFKPFGFHGHCDHDETMGKYVSNVIEKIRHNGLNKTTQKEYEQSHKQRAKRQAWTAIRFVVESKIGSDTGFECNNVGQTVTMGDPSAATSPCTTSRTDDCIYSCTQNDVASGSLRTLLQNQIMEAVVQIYEGILEVQAASGNLILNSEVWQANSGLCYYGVNIPQSYTTTGVPNADMVVYLTARPCSSTGTVAYATGCNWDVVSDDRLGRPKAGIVNMCVRHFKQFESSFSEFEFSGAVKVALHEFTHALGFSSNMYQFFTNGGSSYSCIQTAESRTGTSPAGNSYNISLVGLVTPRIVETARDHYGCPTLNSVELEEAGGGGTAGSHWEQRIVQTELMAGFINPLMPLSRLTLSLLADSGWYRSDYSKAEWWLWGKDKGCEFVTNWKCEESWVNVPGYFCTSGSTTGATPDHMAKGECNYIANAGEEFDPYHQHFPNPRSGGSSTSSNGCPFIQAISGDTFCIDESRSPSAPHEVFGQTSRAFNYRQGGPTLTACWPHRCSSGTLEINLGGTWVACPTGSTYQTLTNVAELSGGSIDCPPASLLCREVANPLGTYVYPGECVAPPTTTSSDEDANCFIATAAYGSSSDRNVLSLRMFRDEYLMSSFLGRQFVEMYYFLSPPIARFISTSDFSRAVTRIALSPIVSIVERLI